MKIAVIGGGAAGFFGAITAAEQGHEVTIYEKSQKLLTKVRVSGGGRCNVTHNCFEPAGLSAHYPRGSRELKRAFYSFQAKDTVEWFRKRGVKLKTEEDGRMFPVTDDSETIAQCLLEAAAENNIRIRTKTEVTSITKTEKGFLLNINGNEQVKADRILAACGGSPKPEGYRIWKELGHKIIPPVPSLFTFNVPNDPVSRLSGLSHHATVTISSTRFSFYGPVLITHWGFSGPAVLKLSAWAARYLNEKDYRFEFYINWAGDMNVEEAKEVLHGQLSGKKQAGNTPLFGMPGRLWLYLLQRAGINEERRWAELGKKDLNRLLDLITRCTYTAAGKTTFKEEFVTCGGISLDEIDFSTMQSKVVPGLFFAGELVDVDGITGGFNFQNAWTTGWLAGKNLAS